MSFILKRRGLETSKNGGKKELTPAMFLGKVGDTTYVSPKNLMAFVEGARLEDVQEFDALLQLTKERLRIVFDRKIRTDKGGYDYQYLNFVRPNAIEGVKAVLIDNVKQFIIDYRDAKFTINFTLDELVAEAEKA